MLEGPTWPTQLFYFVIAPLGETKLTMKLFKAPGFLDPPCNACSSCPQFSVTFRAKGFVGQLILPWHHGLGD